MTESATDTLENSAVKFDLAKAFKFIRFNLVIESAIHRQTKMVSEEHGVHTDSDRLLIVFNSLIVSLDSLFDSLE